MRLTGKCKEDFEKWFDRNGDYFNYPIIEVYQEEIDLGIAYYTFPLSMQYGVYVDFFESEDIRINIHSEIDYIQTYVNDNDLGNHFQFIKEARIEAIKTANEIYNKLIN